MSTAMDAADTVSWPKLAVLTAGAVGCIALSAYQVRKKLHKYVQRLFTSKVVVCSSLEEFKEVEELFLKLCHESSVVGLDCEWVSVGKCRRNVALLQLAPSRDFSVLLRICKMFPDAAGGMRGQCLPGFPDSLRDLLDDYCIVKVGVAICDDSYKLFHDYGLSVRGCLDLRHVLRLFPELNGYPVAGLKTQARTILGVQADTSKVHTCSDWEADALSSAQVDYAASDVILSVQIFDQIVRDRLTLASYRPGWYRKLKAETLAACEGLLDVPFSKPEKNLALVKSRDSSPTAASGIPKKLGCFRSYVTRKTPLYDNCILQAPDGERLSSCNYKKVLWYVDRGLGTVVSGDDEPLAVQLNFEPSNRPVLDSQYYIQNKDNICVVCSSAQSLVRKNVVPHEYRKYFPEIMKNHISHDILLLCLRCHQVSNLRDAALRKALAKECNAPIESGDISKAREDRLLRKVRSAGRALSNARGSLPEDRVTLLEDVLKEHFNVAEVTDEIIQNASDIDTRVYNDDFIPHGQRVVEHFKKTIGLANLEMRWRQHFLDSMHPKYMPPLWSVDHHREVLALKFAQGRAKDVTLSEIGISQELVDTVLKKLNVAPDDLTRKQC
uniref:3'-5' exonuclease domain-containing protein n=1 Tax=Amblyomma maculatum TaxID=34609 RepID=G3MNI8_AMBMU